MNSNSPLCCSRLCRTSALLTTVVLLSSCWQAEGGGGARHRWSQTELDILQSMHLSNLDPISDPGNRYIGSIEAIDLGEALFFSPTLSHDGKTACASCHDPSRYFTSGNVKDGQRNTPTVVGAVTSPWQLWDGKADSLWSQALVPFEDPAEHGLSRFEVVELVLQHFLTEFTLAFGEVEEINQFSQIRQEHKSQPLGEGSLQQWHSLLPSERNTVNRLFAKVGKAIAAYEAQLLPGEARLDGYISAIEQQDFALADDWLTPSEEAGLRIFISEKGQCIRCHNGPMLSNGDFTVTASPESLHDQGRIKVVSSITDAEFGCLSEYSDSQDQECDEVRYLKTEGPELRHAFKVPSLRNITLTAPYMHQGSLSDLHAVVDYYNRAPRNGLTHTELEPLYLLPYQRQQLVDFLSALEGGIRPSAVSRIPHREE
ncbi:cytochrome-c peroxidase [Vibrio sp. WXL210]|uniref:cytochrome-c peroxidase n=1 Tax=Vibrio sp. WXL210 TaxID=3450709 RepID=UPI003EC6297B